MRGKYRNPTIDDVNYIYSNWGQKSVREFASELGLSVYHVMKIVKLLKAKMGLVLPRKKKQQVSIEQVVDNFIEIVHNR